MPNLTKKALLDTLLRGLDAISLATTLSLLFIVASNIVARLLHNLTGGAVSFLIPGAIELSRYTLLFIVFTALPRASVSGMVRVDLVSKRLSIGLASFLDKLWLALMALFCIILAWLFSQKTMLTFSRGDATQDLQIPLFYFYAVISFTSIATALSCLLKAFSQSANTDRLQYS